MEKYVITICDDIQSEAAEGIPTLCFYRTGSCDAFCGIAQWNGNTSKYLYYESICRHAQYITTATTVTSELAEIRAKLALLERADEDNAEAVNDLSEDMRKELDNIYEAIAALSVKVPEARKQPRPIGFKLPKEEK